MCHSTSLIPTSFSTARGVVEEGSSLRHSLPPGWVEVEPLQPPQLQDEFLPLQVERCLIEGLYNALKRPSTTLGPKLLLLGCPGTAPSRRKTSLLNWRKQGKEMRSYFYYFLVVSVFNVSHPELKYLFKAAGISEITAPDHQN